MNNMFLYFSTKLTSPIGTIHHFLETLGWITQNQPLLKSTSKYLMIATHFLNRP